MLRELERAVAAGLGRPIDWLFARECAAHAGGGDVAAVALAGWLASRAAGSGDVCVPLAALAGRTVAEGIGADGEPVRLTAPPLDAWLAALAASPWVAAEGGAPAPLVLAGTRLYLGRLWAHEARLAAALAARMDDAPLADPAALRPLIEALCGGPPGPAPDGQRIAVALAGLKRLVVVTGGPGTGKTTTVVRMLALAAACQPELHAVLLAPTGKAAARLAEAVAAAREALPIPAAARARIPVEAMTVHRFLGARGDGRYRHGPGRPLPADVVVVDEASMLDVSLASHLVSALLPRTRLWLLGDRDQLSSVEAGSVLADLCGSGPAWDGATVAALTDAGALAPGSVEPRADAPPPARVQVALTVSHRFRPDRGPGRLSAAVRTGVAAAGEVLAPGGPFDDDALAWLDWGDPGWEAAVDAWLDEAFAPVAAAPDAEGALAALGRARVLCALREGPAGTAAFNARAVARLGGRLDGDRVVPFRGQALMVTRNDYAVGLYNGDVGVVWPADGERLMAWFARGDGDVTPVPLRQLPAHETAFALTVHKAQGSEYDRVLLVLPPEPAPVVTRELVYTGVTRARDAVCVLATPAAFAEGCARPTVRHSGLAGRLGWPERVP